MTLDKLSEKNVLKNNYIYFYRINCDIKIVNYYLQGYIFYFLFKIRSIFFLHALKKKVDK